MTSALQAIPEWHDVDAETFRRDIATQYRPAVLRGLVKDWPAVRQSAISPEALCRYLIERDNGSDVDAIMTPPEAQGRIFYNAEMDGFNFLRNRLPISRVIEQVLRYSLFAHPPAVAVQSALIAGCLPGLLRDHPMPLLDESVAPRIWFGNAITTPAHVDESNNIACVVSGRRRFTLFPPEQVRNLYVGPLDFNPTGTTPISLVSFRQPDFERFPRFRDALAAALVAELSPGDAIFIPALWWHHVESLNAVNLLVNYWWYDSADPRRQPASGLDALLHCLLNLKGLAPEHRAAWGALFNHYLFDADSDPAGHIPPHRRGVLGDLSPERVQEIRKILIGKLQQ